MYTEQILCSAFELECEKTKIDIKRGRDWPILWMSRLKPLPMLASTPYALYTVTVVAVAGAVKRTKQERTQTFTTPHFFLLSFVSFFCLCFCVRRIKQSSEEWRRRRSTFSLVYIWPCWRHVQAAVDFAVAAVVIVVANVELKEWSAKRQKVVVLRHRQQFNLPPSLSPSSSSSCSTSSIPKNEIIIIILKSKVVSRTEMRSI